MTEINFGALTSGMLKHTVSGGISTPATAIPGTDYVAPGQELNWLGAWVITTAYAANDAVEHDGNSYVANTSTTGNEPPHANWDLLASKGATGDTGLQGDQGIQGIQGIQGVPGDTGAQGGPGLVWQGAYSAITAYVPTDTVSHLGSAYVCILNTTGNDPPNITYWELLAQKGDTGDQGTQGIQGEIGLTGDQGIQGIQGIQGETGLTGDQGEQGVQGVPGLNWLGAYAPATAYVPDDAVSYLGGSYVCILNSTGNLPTNPTYWDLLASKGDTGAGGGTWADLSAELYNAALDTDGDFAGPTDEVVAATGGVSKFELLYLKTTGDFGKAKADAAGTMKACAMAAEAIAGAATGTVLKRGAKIRNDAWNWTIGADLYVSNATAGLITSTPPATESHLLQVVAKAITADIIELVFEETVIEVDEDGLIDLTTEVTGVLPPANGGRGTRTLALPANDGTLDSGNTNYNVDNADTFLVTDLQQTTDFGIPGGTPYSEQHIEFKIECATARALTWNAIFRDTFGFTLPSNTGTAKVTRIGCIYNLADTKYDVVAVLVEA
jgi:hypothetical protein